MLNLKNIINNFEEVKKSLTKRGFDTQILDSVLEMSTQRSDLMTTTQNLESKRNNISKEIGLLKSQGKEVSHILNEVALIKEEIQVIKEKEKSINADINDKLLIIPNLPADDVPLGKGEEENVLIKEHDKIGRGLVEDVIAHYDLAEEKELVDFKRAVKLSGSRFWAYKGDGSKLVRALENYMLDKHIENGYTEWRTPVIAKSEMLRGTGQLPKFEDDMFKIEGTDSYLISTAEITLTNLHNGEIVDLSKPIKYTGFSLCFRAESGSGGKDMKGLIRAHQFNKVELVKLVSHDDLESEFQKTLNDAKGILEDLELPYRELMLCTGDLGFSAEKTVDLEVWLPSEKRYRETSSVSSFNDYQGRRASIRYKKDGNNIPACTINGSALAIDRVVASILENYQNKDKSITIPKVLRKYFDGRDLIK